MIPPRTERFHTKKHFVFDDQSQNRDLNLYLAEPETFSEWFLQGVGKIQAPSIIAKEVFCGHLLESSDDADTIRYLRTAGHEPETNIYDVFWMIQNDREQQVLLQNDELGNVFYVQDQRAVLRTIRVIWSGFHWQLNAHSLDDPNLGWPKGQQVHYSSCE